MGRERRDRRATAASGPPPLVVRRRSRSRPARPATTRAIWRSRRRRDLDAVDAAAADRDRPHTLAAGATDRIRRTTVVYAFVGAIDGSTTTRLLALDDGGAHVGRRDRHAREPDARGRQRRTTSDCADIDVGHDQTWYNQAIVVDPTNPDHVLVGGNLCGMRTLNGTAAAPTWELVSHWLPGTELRRRPRTACLPYVHADWHTATSVVVERQRRDVRRHRRRHVREREPVRPATHAEQVTWTHHNQRPRDAPHVLGRVRRSGDRRSVRRCSRASRTTARGSARTRTIRRRSTSRSAATASARTVHHVDRRHDVLGERRVRPRVLPARRGRLLGRAADGDRRRELALASRSSTRALPDRRTSSTSAPAAPRADLGEDEEPFFVHYAERRDRHRRPERADAHRRAGVRRDAAADGFVAGRRSRRTSRRPERRRLLATSPRRATIPGLYGAVGIVVGAAVLLHDARATRTATWTVAQAGVSDRHDRAADRRRRRSTSRRCCRPARSRARSSSARSPAR